MKKFHQTKKMKISRIILIIITLIFFLTFFFYKTYLKKAGTNIIITAEAKLDKFTKNFLSNNIGYGILNDKNLENILIINKNKDGEILYVDYNLDKAYEALQIVTDVLYENINNLETGKFESIKDNEVKSTEHGLLLEIPFFVYSNNPLLASLGPKLYTKIDFIGSIITNLKSSITNYGINNALVELYVTITITEKLTTPVNQEEIAIDYDVLVASKVINGRVPELYGGIINEKSNILDIPIA